MKLQLFKFKNNEVKLVNLDIAKMNDKGEMPAWFCNNGKAYNSLTNWKELESEAIIIGWGDLNQDIKSVLSNVALKIIEEDNKLRERFIPNHQLDESNEVYKGHMVRNKRRM